MKRVFTGTAYISLWALLAIWSVSALTSLPGLAVSPISEELLKVFPGSTELDIQMLTTLPSLLIIPFILLAGYITEKVGYMRLLEIGLWLFLICGALYFVCNGMGQLIVVSALLGVGAGIIVPLSTLLVSKFFTGDERTKQFGYVSAITNIALVIATAVTGWLADIQWRLPFLVYLLPLIPILLLPALRKASGVAEDKKRNSANESKNIRYASLLKYMLYYLLITVLVMAVSIYLPFLLGDKEYDSAVSGIVTSLFFLAMMTPGLFINRLIEILGRNLLLCALLLIGLGLLDVYFHGSLASIIIGCIAAGFGYGMAQPYIYDSASSLAPASKVSIALALVMTMNYVAIVVSPFIVEFLQDVTGMKGNASPFLLNAIIAFAGAVFMILTRIMKKTEPKT